MSEEKNKKIITVTGDENVFVLEAGDRTYTGSLEEMVSDDEEIWTVSDEAGNFIRREVCEPVIDGESLKNCAKEFFRSLQIDSETKIEVKFE